MMLAWLVLVLSLALFFFYFQITCQGILRREFAREYFRSIARANRLEFPSLQESLEGHGAPVEYSRLREMLKCDYFALTYLLKNAVNLKQRYSKEERLLILYFRWQFVSLTVRHLLRVGERKAALRLTSVLQYFANVIGQRVSTLRLGNLAAADYLFLSS